MARSIVTITRLGVTTPGDESLPPKSANLRLFWGQLLADITLFATDLRGICDKLFVTQINSLV